MKTLNKYLSFLGIALIIFMIAILLIAFNGSNVFKALSGFFIGIFGSKYSIAEVFVKAIPLTLTGLGVAVGFRSGFINLGAEGQLYMGAIFATYFALLFPNLPKIVMIPLLIIVGFIGGGIWALIPGILKAKFKISEIIVSIMFNYIAINIVGIMVRTILKDPDYPYPMSPRIPEGAMLSTLIQSTRLHSGIIIALIATILIYILIWKTPTGYEMRACGINPRASMCSGISIYRNIVLSALISGGLAGLAGMSEIAGLQHKLIEGLSPNYGYTAIIVALIGRNHPLGVAVAAIGISALQVGSLAMQRSAGIPNSISSIIMGAVVILILARKTIFKKLVTEEGMV
ncbi:ABC transporter permease [Natronincola ferrireducens]|uniref:Simple sugar transport system permease protein n=1 Tax=Natronincola ferrireducens TaxID=393762 RepID=A0A1G8Z6Z4_9FIRM|nr:ABC transporter permease [Natronincola ferrireducens]SDK10851.1 simple sugar transport system permease protein [Natronincola ferrireducens]